MPGLTADERAHYHQHGWVVARGVLTEADFAKFEADYTALIHAKAVELRAAGHIQDLCESDDFAHRLANIAAQCSDQVREEDLGPWGQSLDTMHARQRGCFELFFSERLLAAVESIVGEEILLNPIQHFRPYLPARNGVQLRSGAATLTPWHQDQGVTREEADASEIVTCWLPLVSVEAKHGCLQVIPDCVDGGLLKHVKSASGTTIDPECLSSVDRAVDVPMRRGDLLFMNRFTPHRTGYENRSDIVRWSLDLRFQKTGTPTGRAFWPEYILQSRTAPGTVQNSYDEWSARWEHALAASEGERWHRVVGDVGGSIPGAK